MEYGIVRQDKRSHLFKAVAAIGIVILFAIGVAANTFALTHVVYPDGTLGWVDGSSNGGTINFELGPAPESFGYASLRFKTDDSALATAVYGQEVFESLSTVTTLSYYAMQAQASSAGGSAAMFLAVDLDNDGLVDTNLVHEPYLQNAGDPDAVPVLVNEWQQWEAGTGIFWSTNEFLGTLPLVGGVEGSPLYTLDEIRTGYPDAVIASFGISVGSDNPNYEIFVDGITINETVYDFEGGSAPRPPSPTDPDQCKKMGWTSLTNADGTLFENQGLCVAFVQSSLNSAHHQ